MIQDFVIAFGGSGARSAEALLYLYASGATSRPAHVLLIDPDASNGNVNQTRQQLERYHDLNGQLKPGSHEAFFSAGLNREVRGGGFRWDHPRHENQSLKGVFRGVHSPEGRDLLGMLFAEEDFRLDFEFGYVGRAYVGSLDLYQTLRSAVESLAADPEADSSGRDPLQEFFHGLRRAARGSNHARLIVLGSIFGGTGASGIPAIPPLIDSLMKEEQGNISLGTVLLAPYFSFKKGTEGQPEDIWHPLATQSALFHYAAEHVGYDRFYFIGAPSQESTSEHNRIGGARQLNKAHYVEVATALAVLDFFKNSPQRGRDDRTSEVRACGSEQLNWHKLPGARALRLQQRLASFATFCAIHHRFLHEALKERMHEDMTWEVSLQRDTGRRLGGRETELGKLDEFAARFLTWIQEVDDSAAGETLFGLRDLEAPQALGTITAERGRSEDPFHEIVTLLNRQRAIAQDKPVGWYLEALSRATRAFCQTNYDAWWSDSVSEPAAAAS